MRWLRNMRNWMDWLIRDIRRKIVVCPALEAAFETVLERPEQILGEQRGDKNWFYAFHVPEVECVGKVKVRIRYEFGVKASIATTNERTKCGQFVPGAMAQPITQYDGNTLES